MLRDCLRVVSCQLSLCRLPPTAQAMSARDAGGRNVTDVRLVQPSNANLPRLFNPFGNSREVRRRHPENADLSIRVMLAGNTTAVRRVQPANVPETTLVQVLGSSERGQTLAMLECARLETSQTLWQLK